MGAPHGVALPLVAARYFPASSGKYEVKPGLMPLGTDFGNGAADKLTFQFDARFAEYRKVKQAARAERIGKYYQTRDFAPEIAGLVCRFIARRLAEQALAGRQQVLRLYDWDALADRLDGVWRLAATEEQAARTALRGAEAGLHAARANLSAWHRHRTGIKLIVFHDGVAPFTLPSLWQYTLAQVTTFVPITPFTAANVFFARSVLTCPAMLLVWVDRQTSMALR